MEQAGILVTIIIVVGLIVAGVLRHRKRKAPSAGTGGGSGSVTNPSRPSKPGASEDQVER